MIRKEKRSEVLYVSVRKTVKKELKSNYKKMGYNTLSHFVDELLEEALKKVKNETK